MRRVCSRVPPLAAVVLLAAGTIWAGAGNRSNPRVPFDVNEVVRRASHATRHGNGPGSELGPDEFMVDTSIAWAGSPCGQDSSAVAFDGTNYLVVWQDYHIDSVYADVYGTRVTRDGALLDGAGIAISTAVDCQRRPAVAFDGTDYLVTWEDFRDGSTFDIYGARVTQAGVVLDTGGIAISTSVNDQRNSSVAFDGTNYLVAWQDFRSGSDDDIYGARVTQAGVVLDTGGIAISTATDYQDRPAVAFDGTNYLVAWDDLRGGVQFDIYGARVTQAGVVLDTGGIAISTAAGAQRMPAVAFDGTNYLVVWQDYRSGSSFDIYGARLTQVGVVLDAGGIAISTAVNQQMEPAVAFDGTNYMVVWEDYRSVGVYASRVTQAGAVLDTGIAILTWGSGQLSPEVAFDGTNYLAVWSDNRGPVWDVYGVRVTQAGVTLDTAGIAISVMGSNQHAPSVAFDGTNYLVVWEDYRGVWSDIYGARVDQAGTFLDGASIAISTAGGDQLAPSVAFDGTNYMVVWRDLRDDENISIYGARVTQTGTVLDPSGIVVVQACWPANPAIAFDGTDYLIAWEDYRNASIADIYGARVTQAGVVLDAGGIAISTATNDQIEPSVAFDGANYLVAWTDGRNSSDFDIFGARVSQAGVVLDASGFAISTASDNQYNPSAAFDGTNYLVAWHDYRSSSDYDIYGARVTRAGVVLDAGGIAVSTATSDQTNPALSFDGTDYLVVWQDFRSGLGYGDIYGVRVTTAGAVTDSLKVSQDSADRELPALARGLGGQMLSVYDGWVERRGSLNLQAWRTLGRFTSRDDDVGAALILAPTGAIDSATSVTPACSTFNGGTTTVSYQVRMKVGNSYNETASVANHAPGTSYYLGFPAFTARERGSLVVRCSTMLSGDLDPANNLRTGSVTVNVKDVGCSRVAMPGTIDSGAIVTPACTVYNYGTTTESYNVRMKIGAVYDTTAAVSSHLPGTYVAVSFPTWLADQAGVFPVTCSTELAGDMVSANNRQTDTVYVVAGTVKDVGCSRVAMPGTTIDKGAVVTPACTVYNYGTTTESYNVRMKIGTGYDTVASVSSHAPGTYVRVSFPTWLADQTGTFPVTCSTELAGDLVNANDRQTDIVYVITDTTWVPEPQPPLGGRGKTVSDGGAMASLPGNGDTTYSFLLKGNNTCEFYVYNSATGAWTTLESIPRIGWSSKKKTVKKGADLVAVEGKLYAFKGNSTNEFWCYTPSFPGPSGIAAGSWQQYTDVPGDKKCKDGTGAATVVIDGTPYVYLLKGGTNEFYRNSVAAKGTWETETGAPLPPSGKVYKTGSAIVYYPDDKDGKATSGRIFALKGSYNEFYAYDIITRGWTDKAPLPLTTPPSTKKTKVKAGAGLAYSPSPKQILALKGNKTQEFWKYEALGNLWTRGKDVPLAPSGKKVGPGGAISCMDGFVYIVKGNKTSDFYSMPVSESDENHLLSGTGPEKNVQGQSAVRSPQFALNIAPNPFTSSLNPSIFYSLPFAGNVSLKLYDITGKLVSTLVDGFHPAGSYRYSLLTTHHSLASGIYLLTYEAGDYRATEKLTIE